MINRREIILNICLAGLFLHLPTVLHAWTGYNYDTGDNIETDEDITAIQGKDIEIYDYQDESFHEGYVRLVSSDGKEVDVYGHVTLCGLFPLTLHVPCLMLPPKEKAGSD